MSAPTAPDGRPTPRMRDLPPPRENPSIIGPLFRWIFQWPYRFALFVLHRAGFRPYQLTLLSLAGNAVVGYLLLTGRRFLPGILLLPAGLFDIFDGGVARLRGEETRKGALLDAVIDRASDIVVFGCLFFAEFVVHRQVATAGMALAAMIASLLVSDVRAEGEAAGLDMSEGSVQRLERYVGLTFGLTAPGMLLPVLAALTVAGLFTTAQRVVTGWRGLDRASRAA
ncbi:MAG TPA: CDP-alcohol phosphatidyltransferase family protein [Actinomycetota bacterium]|nr:CDP-alcohol phosphatidyltransferase family protein [Actinomycetota bacterium]